MLKKIIDKRNYIILLIIIVLIILLIIKFNTAKEQTKTFYYFSENILVNLYTNKNTSKIFNDIDNIYKEYNAYYKNPNHKQDKQLIELLKYGQKLYHESHGLIDITTDKLIKKIDNDEAFKFTSSMDKLDFQDPKTLKNINVDSLIGAFATRKVEAYLKEKGIDKYIINEDGNIITGNSYDHDKFKISLHDLNGAVLEVVSLENESLAVKGNTSTFKTYMVNPLTSKKISDSKQVMVIADDINTANFLANTLYLMDINEGKEFIKAYDAEAFWYTNDGKKEMTKDFKNYLQKSK